jgi:hypothetical protein
VFGSFSIFTVNTSPSTHPIPQLNSSTFQSLVLEGPERRGTHIAAHTEHMYSYCPMNDLPSLDAQILAAAWPAMSVHERGVWWITHHRTLERQTLGFMESLQLVMDGNSTINITNLDDSIGFIQARMKFLRQYAQACEDRRGGLRA